MTTAQNDYTQTQEQAHPTTPVRPGFQTPEEARDFLQQEARNRVDAAQEQVAVILRDYRVRIEPHITVTPRGQYAELHFIPE